MLSKDQKELYSPLAFRSLRTLLYCNTKRISFEELSLRGVGTQEGEGEGEGSLKFGGRKKDPRSDI